MMGTEVPEKNISTTSVALLRAYVGTGTAYERHAASSPSSRKERPAERHLRAHRSPLKQPKRRVFGGSGEKLPVGRVGRFGGTEAVGPSAADKTSCGLEMVLSDLSVLWRFAWDKTSNAFVRNVVCIMVNTLAI